jgi:hypothetical protein
MFFLGYHMQPFHAHSLKEILKSMTSYMTDFVVIPNIYDLEALSCNI